jgi:hypothetical protein
MNAPSACRTNNKVASDDLYSLTAVENFIANELEPKEYTVDILHEGVLLDEMIAYPPSDDYYLYVFRVQPLNEWSSAYRMEQYEGITPELQQEIDNEYAEY